MAKIGRVRITYRSLEDFFLPKGYKLREVRLEPEYYKELTLFIEGPDMYDVEFGEIVPEAQLWLNETGEPCKKCGSQVFDVKVKL